MHVKDVVTFKCSVQMKDSDVLCLCVTQVTMTGLDLPFAAFAPRAYDLEENDPMV